MKTRTAFVAATLVIAGSLAGFALKTVLADGIPSPNPLYYSGTLTEAGQLVNAARPITINLWLNASATLGETALCVTTVASTPVINGRFRIALDGGCKAAINTNPAVYVEVVDNGTSLGRSKIGAVPYAVEADHAVNATTAATANAAGGSLATTLSTLQGQVHPASAFHAWLTTSPSVPNATRFVIAFDHVAYDLAGEYGATTGVFSPKTDGIYLITCAQEYNVATPMEQTAIITVNGAEATAQDLYSNGSGSTPAAVIMTKLSAGASVTCGTYQNSGTAQPIYASFPQRNSFAAARIY